MQNKQNAKAKVIVIAIAILLCLALAVGITGAFYQAQRRATGTVKMDKGIVIDYTGFGKTPNEGIWVRENETTFRLFSDTDVQPGEKISLNDAGIRANASSVDFYARVKLSYEFYNVVGDVETPVALANPSDLITTSATFFGADWVDSGAGDGYYYYATGTTLNKFTKATPATFVDLFDTNARFIIEGAGFTGAYPDGEGGGFVVDETTSINKIVVYLTLETLQGDADATAEGWKISSQVDFSKVSAENASIVTSGNGTPVEETLNVTINDTTTNLSEVKFPYDIPTTLEFNSKNVEYVELIYSDDTTEKFYELAASEESATKYSQIQLAADSSRGTVKGYIVGVFSDSEYTGFTFSTTRYGYDENEDFISYPISDGIVLAGYFGTDTKITIPGKIRARERDFKVEITGYTDFQSLRDLIDINLFQFPCKVNGVEEISSAEDFEAWLLVDLANLSTEEFMARYPKFVLTYGAIVETSNVFYGYKDVVAVRAFTFRDNTNITEVTISEGVKSLDEECFSGCRNLDVVNIKGNKLETVKQFALRDTKLTKLVIDSITPPDISNWLIDFNENTKVYVPAAYLEAYKTALGITEDGILGTF